MLIWWTVLQPLGFRALVVQFLPEFWKCVGRLWYQDPTPGKKQTRFFLEISVPRIETGGQQENRKGSRNVLLAPSSPSPLPNPSSKTT